MFNFIFAITVFILGICIGSFLNVIIFRLHKNLKGVWFGRSICLFCKKNILKRDLIPIFSYLFLKGRCRFCLNKISVQYILVEFFTGIIFLLSFLSFAKSFNYKDILHFVFLLYIISVLIIIFVYDLKYLIIPDKIIIPAIIFVLVFNMMSYDLNKFFYYLLTGIGVFLFFLFLFVLTDGKGIGGGDLRMGFFLGVLLGFPNSVYALMLSYIFASIFALFIIMFKKGNLKTQIPFGPFLALGIFLLLLYDNYVADIFYRIFFSMYYKLF